MVASLRVQRSLRQLRAFLLWASGILLVIGIAMGALVPEHPWGSVALGVLAAWAMFAVSAVTMKQAVRSEVPHVGWISLDYVTKIAITGGAIFWARSADYLNVTVVAILVIAAILAGTVAQVMAFVRPVSQAKPDSEPGPKD